LVFLPIALTLVLAAQAPDDTRTAIVSGRVIDAGTGRPIAGAIVMPFGTAAAPAPAGDSGAAPPPLRVLTNAGGHFVIRGLHKGSLVLLASRGGYIDAAYGQSRPAGYGQPIPIAPGQRITDLETRMWRHGVITGTVLDEAGEPVIGIRVQAMGGGHVAGRRRYGAGASGTTDDRGVYRIAQLVPGDYLVAVPSKQTSIPTEVMDVFFAGGTTRAQRDELGRELATIDAPVVPAGSRYATSSGALTIPLAPGTATPTSRPNGGLLVYPTAFYPAATSAAEAAPVTVKSGEERANVDIQLRLEPSARVSGTLVAPEGMASHVPIRLLPVGNDALGAAIDAAATITDARGGFTFVGVPPGQYTLTAVRVPRPPVDPDGSNRMTVQVGAVALPTTPPAAATSPPPPAVPADATLWARQPLAVSGNYVSDIVVPLRAGARMSGRVEFDGTAPRPDPAAVANLRINLEPADGSPAARDLLDTGHPDEQGLFRTLGVPPGQYIVKISGHSLPGWVFKGAQFEGRDLADTPVDLQSRDIAGVVLTFTDRPSTLEGIVRNAANPDGDAVVLIYPIDAEAWSIGGASPRRMRAARTMKDGSFSVTNLPAGEYYAVAVADERADWQDPAVLRAVARAAEQVRILDGERKSLNLHTVKTR
jgi:protocatechuate 3,4-dioxygenase beta subunit